MLRKVLLSLGAGALFFGIHSAPAYAIVECPTGEIAETVEECPTDSNTADSANFETDIMPINLECDEATDADCSTADGSVVQPEKPTGTPVLPDTTEEEAVAEDIAEEASEPEMWPVYASLGALGATLLLIIIINLTGRKSKK